MKNVFLIPEKAESWIQNTWKAFTTLLNFKKFQKAKNTSKVLKVFGKEATNPEVTEYYLIKSKKEKTNRKCF